MQLRNHFSSRVLLLLLAGASLSAAQSSQSNTTGSSQQPQPSTQQLPQGQPGVSTGGFPSAQQPTQPQQQNSQQQPQQQSPNTGAPPLQPAAPAQPQQAQQAQQGSQPPTQMANPGQQPAQVQPDQNQTGVPGGRTVDTIQMAPGQRQTSQGQEPTQNDQGVFVFKKNVEEVVLYATVVDEKGRIVTDLPGCGRVNTGPCGPGSAFTVYEDGQPREIKQVERRDVPVALGILIDNSGSMREKRERVNIASLDLVKSSNPDDKVFLVNFNDTYYLDTDFTNSVPTLREGLEKVESRGGTALYDAVVASADYLEKSSPQLEARDHIQKKAMFVVTDGEDNMSTESLEQTVRRLSDENAPTVYTIGVLDKDERTRKAKRALQAIAEQTGGLAFFPKDAGEVDEIARTVARDIRSQYVIVFKKPQGGDTTPGYRQIKVVARAPGHKNLQVRTLSGYYSGQKRASR
jgi:Ca-activated chloride channel family protein